MYETATGVKSLNQDIPPPVPQYCFQVLKPVHRLPVHRKDDISALDACPFQQPVMQPGDSQPMIHLKSLLDLCCQRLEFSPQPLQYRCTVVNGFYSAILFKFRNNFFHHIYRNGK